ncbi:transcription factor A, mitochondrial-like [Homarus americanus]|uniref:Transcription factor A-like 1 n=1 Tax=Homarus americanus TaxID=6706 RepID=A0A8J5NC92_HOMAM|nr:transcription factor A, mitochondrial-like [Homarus americanus]KAG7177082.1 Transcription factor A-like 1 [Homarus americanus]
MLALSRLFTARCSLTRGMLVRCTGSPLLAPVAYKQTIAQELGLPEPPKRPVTPYIRFLVHHQEGLRRKSPQLSMREIGKTVLHKWENLTFEEKSEWSQAYERDKAVYDVRYMDYMKSLSPQQIKSMKELKLKRSEEKLRQVEDKVKVLEVKTKREEGKLKAQLRLKKKRECKELGKPKSPITAFALYINSLEEENASFKDILIVGATKWHTLPKETQDWYLEKAKEQREEYQHDLLDWEITMFKKGRRDLVRVSQLEEISKRLGN